MRRSLFPLIIAALIFSVSTASAGATTIKVRKSASYGKYLTDSKGLTLYLFTRDKGKGKSTCFGSCEKAWPIVKGKPKLGKGVKGKVGTTKRKDGRVQGTLNGHPLYYYVDERRAGQILCQDVFEFGGTWLIVSPSGKAIR
jgi:predicted lipoprotein with Yx(FWY)xxD motif